MKTYKKEITVYDFEGIFDGFCVEVDCSGEMTEIYLYHKDYADKMLMFGIDIKDEWEIRDIIAANIEEHIKFHIDEYIEDYIYEFVDIAIA